MNFETLELTPRIGTEIKASKEELLKDGLREEIRELLEQRGVLLFRELNMTDEEQVEFAQTLGEVIPQGSRAMTIGAYYDRYVEEGGRWLFQWRHWGVHYRGLVDLSAPFVNCPDYRPPPGLPGPDEPTFTRRA